jgi:hypothetical protein
MSGRLGEPLRGRFFLRIRKDNPMRIRQLIRLIKFVEHSAPPTTRRREVTLILYGPA